MRRIFATAIVALLPALVFGPCPAAAGAPPKVWLRDDQTIMVGQQPFFPIGLYYCAEELMDPTGRQLTDLRQMGSTPWGSTFTASRAGRRHLTGRTGPGSRSGSAA